MAGVRDWKGDIMYKVEQLKETLTVDAGAHCIAKDETIYVIIPSPSAYAATLANMLAGYINKQIEKECRPKPKA